MKSLLIAMSLVSAFGNASAAPSQPVAALSLGQGLAQPTLVLALNNVSAEGKTGRSTQTLAATPPTAAGTVDGAGFELESGVLLTLAGVMALLIVSRRRLPR